MLHKLIFSLKNGKMNDENLKILLLASQAGNKESYRQFLEIIMPIVEKKCQHGVFKKDHVDDLVQESMLAIHKGLSTFDSNRPVIPWVYVIIQHKIIDYLRKSARNKEDSTGFEMDTIAEVKQDVTNESPKANDLIERLPEKLRQPLYLTKVKGYSTAEAAKLLGMKENALRTRLSRAYEKLKQLIEEKGIENE
ncbi:MAG: RNA polymerase sigma factor [Bacteriovoracaceae bacterium]